MQLSCETAVLTQQEFGLATAGKSVKLRKLRIASRKLMIGVLRFFMNLPEEIPCSIIPCRGFVVSAEFADFGLLAALSSWGALGNRIDL